MYDLEVAICKNEDIEKFEELGLGPLLRHPLVLQYFSVNSETTEVFKITSEEIVQLLIKYLKNKKEVKGDCVEEFLDFIVKKRPVATKENLGIRIHTLGYATYLASYFLSMPYVLLFIFLLCFLFCFCFCFNK